MKGTDSKAKNELLYSKFGINYNNLSPMFRKGSILIRLNPDEEKDQPDQLGLLGNQNKSPKLPEENDEQSEVDLPDGEKDDRSIQPSGGRGKKVKKVKPFEGLTGDVGVIHEDMINERFWRDRSWLLL